MNLRNDYMMSINIPNYNLNPEVNLQLHCYDNFCYFSLYDDTDSKSIALECSKEKLKGLADFINNYLKEKNNG